MPELETEWGVRFPSGAVQSYGTDEAGARRFALATTALRPDLPTLVVRQVVTPWTLADGAPGRRRCEWGQKGFPACQDRIRDRKYWCDPCRDREEVRHG